MATTKERIEEEARKKRLGDLQRLQRSGSFLTNEELGDLEALQNPSGAFRTAEQLGTRAAPRQLVSPPTITPTPLAQRNQGGQGGDQAGANQSGGGTTPKGPGEIQGEGGTLVGPRLPNRPELGRPGTTAGQENIQKTVTDIGGGQGRATFTGEGIGRGIAEITAPLEQLRRPSRGTFSTVGSITGGGPGTLNPEGEVRGQPVIDAINNRFDSQVSAAQENRKRVLGEIARRDALDLAAKQNAPIESLIKDITSGRETRASVKRQLGALQGLVSQNTQNAIENVQARENQELATARLGSDQDIATFNRASTLAELGFKQNKEERDIARQTSIDEVDRFVKLGNFSIDEKKRLSKAVKDAGEIAGRVGEGKLDTASAVSQVSLQLSNSGLPQDFLRNFFPNLTDEQLGLTQ